VRTPKNLALMKLSSLAILFTFFIKSIVLGQELRTTTYQIEQGLPTTLTKAIFQDETGFVWIASDMGLIRFDGKHFNLYEDLLPTIYVKSFYQSRNGDLLVIHDLGVSKIINSIDTLIAEPFLKGHNSFTDSTVLYPKAAYEDLEGGLWISEPQSITLYKNGKLKRYHFHEKSRTSSFSRSYQLTEDQYGNLWVISQSGIVFYLDKGKDEFIEVTHNQPIVTVSSILKTGRNRIWLGTDDRVWEMRISAQKQITSLKPIIERNNVSYMVEDKQGYIYMGTWFNGLYRAWYEGDNLKHEPVNNLKLQIINDLFINENNDIWVSSDDGVGLLQVPFFSKLNLNSDRTFIQGLTKGDNGKLYTTNGGVIFEISANENNEFQAKQLYYLSNNETILHVVHNKGLTWFGTTHENLYWLEDNKVNKIQLQMGGGIFNISTDSKGNLWVCHNASSVLTRVTPEKGVIHYGKNKGILSPVYVVKEDDNGKIICGGGGNNHFLYEYDEKTDSFINITPKAELQINNLSVDDIAPDKDKTWLATNHGLYLYQNEAIKKIDLGLLKNIQIIKSVAVGEDGGLWIGTNSGLLKYANGQTLLFDDFNGLPSKTLTHRSLIIDKQNRVWVGTSTGVGYSKPATIGEMTKTPTPLFLSLTINGKKVDTLKAEYPNNSYLQAKFISLTYPAGKIVYQYRLKGFHPDWITLADKLDVVIPQIPNGNYTFEVRAIQQGEYLWSDSASYSFNIKVAWYLSYWAIIVYVIILSFLIWLIVKLNTARLLKEKQNLEKIIFERTAEIMQQKEEIEAQRDTLLVLNEDIVEKKNKLEEKSKELQNAFNEINQQKKELETLNATKDKFFSIVAHDLKGPLNSLSSFSSLLADYTDALTPEEIKKVAGDLNQTVKNTFNLTENLLTWARAQMDKVSHDPENIDLNQIIINHQELFANQAKNKNIAILTELEPDVKVFSDKDQLRFVLRNLISNALKFTKPDGTVTVKTEVKNGQARISVSDTGVGMEEVIANKIFDIGSKHSTIGTGGEKGTGLGLLLCKEFVEKNGGKIKVKSTLDVGSTFTFTVNLAKEEALKS
jgi:signal transduction histidine kinase/ligand-binding sensor domain-containing protein